jgi:LPXTG-site transpeptidase (sortase) family protein
MAGRAVVGGSILTLLLLMFSSSQNPIPALPAEPAPPAAPAVIPPPAAPLAEVASPPLHITYPAVGMDQGVLPLSQTEEEKTSGSIVPPATPEAYWLSPYGSPGPGSTNTTYIVGHSWEGRSTAFNNISTRSRLGDQLMLTTAKGSLSYQVTAITTENKETLRASGIWAKVPGRLILITCYTEDLWGTNIIIEASPLGSVQLVG